MRQALRHGRWPCENVYGDGAAGARMADWLADLPLDRSVLERTAGAFEHLLRNSVAHGIEMPEVRTKADKDATGTLRTDPSK